MLLYKVKRLKLDVHEQIVIQNKLTKMNNEQDIEIKTLRKEIQILKTKMFNFDFVKQNNQITFYTGLQNISAFEWIISRIESNIALLRCKIITSSLTIRDKVLMVLMKLRLGLLNEDIAHRFHVSRSAVQRIFKKVLPLLAAAVENLIIWPDRDVTRASLPRSFKKAYKDTVGIIDCTEIFIQRPSDLTARAEVYSTYKNHSTVKYLVCVSPTGGVMFLSCGWGGRVSDKEITLKSKFLDFTQPGDLVLADRGFLIEEELNRIGAYLKMPYFKRGKNQLSAGEVDTSRQLSNVRIHVERVIGSLKKFHILQNTLPLTLAPLIDKIMIAICGINNLNRSIVPH